MKLFAKFALCCVTSVFAAMLFTAALCWAGPAAESAAETSTLMPMAHRSILVAGAAAGDRLVAVGERGHILLSDDGGQHWRQVQTPTRTLLTAVAFADANNGWAVGHDAVILRTTDAGESWQRVHFAPELDQPLLDVWFKDAQNGFAMGAYGYFLATADGGVTWHEQRVSEEDDWHLNRLSRCTTGRLYIAAEAGSIYVSDNGGGQWAKLPLDYEGSMFGILPLKADTVLAYGLRGNLFRSQDAGQSWSKVPTGTQSTLSDALQLADGRIVIAGQAGTVLVSDDGGKSFRLHRQTDRKAIAALMAGSSGEIITLGEGGIKRVSADFTTSTTALPAASH